MRLQWYTKIIKVGNSFGAILPVQILRLMKMDKKGQWVKISMSPKGDTILVTKTKKPRV